MSSTEVCAMRYHGYVPCGIMVMCHAVSWCPCGIMVMLVCPMRYHGVHAVAWLFGPCGIMVGLCVRQYSLASVAIRHYGLINTCYVQCLSCQFMGNCVQFVHWNSCAGQ